MSYVMEPCQVQRLRLYPGRNGYHRAAWAREGCSLGFRALALASVRMTAGGTGGGGAASGGAE